MKKSLREAIEIDSLDVPGLGSVTRGLRVRHRTFGPGTVVAVIEWGCEAGHAISVQFDGAAGRKCLHPAYAKLELIDGPTARGGVGDVGDDRGGAWTRICRWLSRG